MYLTAGRPAQCLRRPDPRSAAAPGSAAPRRQWPPYPDRRKDSQATQNPQWRLRRPRRPTKQTSSCSSPPLRFRVSLYLHARQAKGWRPALAAIVPTPSAALRGGPPAASRSRRIPSEVPARALSPRRAGDPAPRAPWRLSNRSCPSYLCSRPPPQPFAQPMPRLEQPGFHGFFRDPQGVAHFRVGQLREVPQDHDEPVVLGQADQGRINGCRPFQCFDPFQRPARRIRLELLVQRLVRRPSAPRVEALVDDDPVNPAEEPPVRVVAVQALVGPDERVLGRIQRVLVVPEHPPRDRKQDPLVPAHDRLERGGISTKAPGDADDVVFGLWHQYTPAAEKLVRPGG